MSRKLAALLMLVAVLQLLAACSRQHASTSATGLAAPAPVSASNRATTTAAAPAVGSTPVGSLPSSPASTPGAPAPPVAPAPTSTDTPTASGTTVTSEPQPAATAGSEPAPTTTAAPGQASSGGALGQIVFAGYVADQVDPSTPIDAPPSHIYVVNADGSGLKALTEGSQDGSPVWSPDGSRIAYVSYGDQDSGIYVMQADGSKAQLVFRGSAGQLSWSPDGRLLAFSGIPNPPPDQFSGNQIYVVGADGSNPRNLSQSQDENDRPAWSPDGRQIAFLRPLASSMYDAIYLMNADGGNQHQLTGPDVQVINTSESWLPWSPDGRSLLFDEISFTDGSSSASAAPVAVTLDLIGADGGNLRRLTDKQTALLDARWSPDGATILLSSVSALETDGKSVISVLRADGSNPRRLSDRTTNAGAAVWSPDGRQIAFLAQTGEVTMNSSSGAFPLAYGNLMVVNAAGGDPHSILANIFPTSGDAATGFAWQPRRR